LPTPQVLAWNANEFAKKKEKKPIYIISNTKDYIKVHHPKHCQNLNKLSTQKQKKS
jgi:hypothetical protein